MKKKTLNLNQTMQQIESCHSQKLSAKLEGFVILGVLRSVSCCRTVNHFFLWGSRLDLHQGTMLLIQPGQLIGRGTTAIFCQNHRLCQVIQQIRDVLLRGPVTFICKVSTCIYYPYFHMYFIYLHSFYFYGLEKVSNMQDLWNICFPRT